jgi:hypothetical protein
MNYLMDHSISLIGLLIFSYQLYRVVLSKVFGPKVYVNDSDLARGLMNLGLERKESYKKLVRTMADVNSTTIVKGDF